MKPLHLECLPDEAIARRMGKTVKSITHHVGKSRIMNKLKTLRGQVAMVDEDPQSAKHPHEYSLQLKEDRNGLKVFTDKNGNKVVMVCPRLEEWLINICSHVNVNPENFGLPANGNELHKVINQRIPAVKKLIAHLKQQNSPAIAMLESEII